MLSLYALDKKSFSKHCGDRRKCYCLTTSRGKDHAAQELWLLFHIQHVYFTNSLSHMHEESCYRKDARSDNKK